MRKGSGAAAAIALLLSLLAAFAGCPRTSKEGTARAPFTPWCKGFGPLATTQSDISEGRNWYLPAAFTGLDMNRRLWSRDFMHAGLTDFIYARDILFYLGSTGYVGALDAATGDTLWEFQPAPEEECRTRDRPMLALTPYSLVAGTLLRGRTDEVRFYNPANGDLLRRETVDFAIQHLLLVSGRVVAVGERGECATFARETGNPVAARSQPTSLKTALAAEERLLLLGYEDALHSLDVETLKPVASRILESACWFPFVLDGELLIFRRSDQNMLALNPLDLATIWRMPLEGWPGQLPAGRSGRVYFGEAGGVLRCVEPDAQRSSWTRDLEAPAHLFVVFDNCLLAMADYQAPDLMRGRGGNTPPGQQPSWYLPGNERYHNFYVISLVDGSVIAEFPGPGQLLLKLVTPFGVVAQENIGGPVSCFPATITPREGAP